MAHFLVTDLNDEVSSKVNSNKSKRKSANDFDFAESFQGKKMYLIPLKPKPCANESYYSLFFWEMNFSNLLVSTICFYNG